MPIHALVANAWSLPILDRQSTGRLRPERLCPVGEDGVGPPFRELIFGSPLLLMTRSP
jgi:hypothetical protein